MSQIRRQVFNAWDPFREFQQLSDRLNRAFQGQSANADEGREQALKMFDWVPSVNISETEKAYFVRADLPEVKKEEVKVTHENGVLTIEGERRQDKRDESEKFHRVESNYGRFARRFTLPEDAQEESIEATFKDGSLIVLIPKAEPKRPRARQINVA